MDLKKFWKSMASTPRRNSCRWLKSLIVLLALCPFVRMVC
jgi:antibiotic biosynthesis monooxygenase (ABM) superfamily enzyme